MKNGEWKPWPTTPVNSHCAIPGKGGTGRTTVFPSHHPPHLLHHRHRPPAHENRSSYGQVGQTKGGLVGDNGFQGVSWRPVVHEQETTNTNTRKQNNNKQNNKTTKITKLDNNNIKQITRHDNKKITNNITTLLITIIITTTQITTKLRKITTTE